MPLETSTQKLRAANKALAKSVLSDMVINEVSMVDRAANLREWVVVKRAPDDAARQNGIVCKLLLARAEADNAVLKAELLALHKRGLL